jgi:mannose-1-phosphate guanylyltransferase / mannose-6-phosphate isomerase
LLGLICPVILVGGKGTRLWPASRLALPKPFLKIFGDKSFFQETCERVGNTNYFSPPVIVGHIDHESYILQQLEEINLKNYALILEPCGRNTTPALTLAALYLQGRSPSSFMLMLPSDHWIESIAEFEKAIFYCHHFLKTQEGIVNLTIKASESNANFGHILRSPVGGNFNQIYKVTKFLEKPSLDQLKVFESKGEYYWNTGIFLTRPSTLLGEIAKYAHPTFVQCQEALRRAQNNSKAIYLHLKDCAVVEDKAIDYSIMSHTNKLYTTSLNCQWSDAGTWSSIAKIIPQDEKNNRSMGNVRTYDSEGCFTVSMKPLVYLIGVKDITTIVAEDAVLIMGKNQDSHLKQIVEVSQQEQIKEFCEISEHHKPWGSFKIIHQGDSFQIKEINVLPGKQLSLQSHQHRSERWTVLVGEAEVTLYDKTSVLREQESIFIPANARHRLKNATPHILKVLEIQFGSRILESDIIRYQDDFYRA